MRGFVKKQLGENDQALFEQVLNFGDDSIIITKPVKMLEQDG